MRSACDRGSKYDSVGAFWARSAERKREVLGALRSERNGESKRGVRNDGMGAARAHVKVLGTAMLEVGMSVTVVSGSVSKVVGRMAVDG